MGSTILPPSGMEKEYLEGYWCKYSNKLFKIIIFYYLFCLILVHDNYPQIRNNIGQYM